MVVSSGLTVYFSAHKKVLLLTNIIKIGGGGSMLKFFKFHFSSGPAMASAVNCCDAGSSRDVSDAGDANCADADVVSFSITPFLCSLFQKAGPFLLICCKVIVCSKTA